MMRLLVAVWKATVAVAWHTTTTAMTTRLVARRDPPESGTSERNRIAPHQGARGEEAGENHETDDEKHVAATCS